jgi:hypothetical protein
MKNWKVIVTVKENKNYEQKIVFVKKVETIEEVHLKVKQHFIEERLDLVFCRVEKIIEI